MEVTVDPQGEASVSEGPADQPNRLHPCRDPAGHTRGCRRTPLTGW